MGIKKKEYVLSLPVCPPLNHQKAIVQGRMVKSKADRDYTNTVQLLCMKDRLEPLNGEIGVKINWYRERKAGDIDRFKTLLDALQGFAYHNDSQVSKLEIERFDTDPEHPRLFVQIHQL